ncbi:MAG: helix-turn-helix transcriptional regulator [Roseivirga sp.]|nr:helix-turn-helix transcriptional regulator [Roseivirga sp.]
MDIIFVLGASQALFLSLLVFNKKGKSHGDYVLGAWLAFMGLHLIEYYVHSTGIHFEYPHLLGLGECFPMLQGPFMFVYVLLMIGEKGKLKPVYLLHGLPFLIFMIYFLLDFYLLGAEEKLAYYLELVEHGSPVLSIATILNNFLGPVYVVLSLVKLSRHARNISNRFSYTEEIDLKWLRYVLAGMGVVWTAVLVSYILDWFITNEELGNQLIYGTLTVAVFFLGFYGIKQQAIYIPAPATPRPQPQPEKARVTVSADTDRYKNSGLKKEAAERYLKELLAYMEEEKPYLNGRLSLKDVAQYLNISVNHLSQIINEQLHKSFFDFVNTYRVEEVKRLLSESRHEQLTLLAIAYDSGFNSKSSFNSIFKKITGVTPSQYLKLKSDQAQNS